MSLNILILAIGSNASENPAENYPSCLSEDDGISLLEKIVSNTKTLINSSYTFAFLKKEIDEYHLDRVANLLVNGANVVPISEGTMGSACTSLLAACDLDLDNELLIISANELVDVDLLLPLKKFKQSNYDAGTIVFKSIHPRYSYVKLNEESLVVQASQKKPISNTATTGIFWYKKTSLFIDAAKSCIVKSSLTDGKFYIAPTFNELLLKHLKVGIFEIQSNQYIPLKTNRQIYNFEKGV